MQIRKLISFGFAALLAGLVNFGMTRAGHASPIAAHGATLGIAAGENSIVLPFDGDVVKIARKRGRGFRRGGFKRRGKLRRAGNLRRGNKIRRHGGYKNHNRYKRHKRHRRHGRRHHRRSRIFFSYGFPYGYGYGSPFYGYGSSYEPPIAYVAPRYRRSSRRASYRGSCRSLGVGTQRWANCCSRKYRSFNRRTGNYLAHSGRYRACR